PQKVPVTVLSRCLQFNLRPMAPETIREHLQTVLQTEQVVADQQSLRLLARAARGSMRDALSLTDQAIAFGSGSLEEATVRQMLGSVDRSYVFRLLDALAQGDGKTVVETSELLRQYGLSAASTLEEMSTLLQRMAVLQAVPDAPPGDEPDAELAELSRLAGVMPPDETQLLYSICLHGRGELGLAPDEYAALTMVLLRLLAFKPTGAKAAQAEKKTLKKAVPAADPPAARISVSNQAPALVDKASVASENVAIQALPASFEPIAQQPLPAGQHLPVVTMPGATDHPAFQVLNQPLAHTDKAQAATTIEAIQVRVQADSMRETLAVGTSQALRPSTEGDFWHATVQTLIAAEAISAMVRELALQSQLVARDTDQWLLRVERESLNQSGSRDRLAAALAAAGHPVRLAIEVGRVTDSPARRNAAALNERQLMAEKIVFDDPFVQSMMREFGAKIVPGSIKPV
ncbi:MAG TPA: DNA polymerase III subunit gamma/tau C-terminal domain-containing protein, partial [Rhodoferax sp.]|nr:DNA polymerase III subunit gamma/tau C-terminal domain-containing protein [Rhodoferax sp.]